MTDHGTLVPSERVCFRVPGQPVAKGRPIAGRGFNGHTTLRTPEKTVAYESLVSLVAQQAMGSRPPFAGPIHLVVEILLAIPTSWSKRRQAMAEAGLICATKTPDADNVLKAIQDGMNGIVWVDDAQAVEYRISKKYGTSPGVYVEAMELPLEKA
jgi:Holliday junction resolvase RusA-like endonuclease